MRLQISFVLFLSLCLTFSKSLPLDEDLTSIEDVESTTEIAGLEEVGDRVSQSEEVDEDEELAATTTVEPTTYEEADKESNEARTDAQILEDWELVQELNIYDALPVMKYRSKRTGLTVIFATAQSPIVNAYFCLATEAKTNDGLPHTLEHLIFLGSKRYPYKEVLDLMANRCLADRTNAWTDTDTTCYTVYTAGQDGFLNILPVYLDHIFFPTLREQDFLTEVHHITKEGEDAGVVYSEMQGVENSKSNIVYYTAINEVYPGNSSYEIQTGGRLKNLRERTNMTLIRAYHKKYYQPKNMAITVTGSVDPAKLFRAIEQTEEDLMNTEYPEFVRPFQEDYPTLTENIDKDIEVPGSAESLSDVRFTWRLPFKLWDGVQTISDLKVLGSYLTGSSISPLMEAFVNTKNGTDPIATDVDFSVHKFGDPALSIEVEDVSPENVDKVEPMFLDVLAKIRDGGRDVLDMERIQTLINRIAQSYDMKLENSPHTIVPTKAIQDLVYGQTPQDFSNFLEVNQKTDTDRQLALEPEYWIDLMNKTLLNNPRVKLTSRPSTEINARIGKENEARKQKRIEEIGAEGLAKLDQDLQNAIDSQILPPTEVLQSIPFGDASNIVFRPFTFYNHTTENRPPKGFDLDSIPFPFHLDSMDKTKFVRFYAFVNMSGLSMEDRKWLVLLTESWLSAPLEVDGKVLEYVDVLQERSNDLLTLYNDLGYKGGTFTPGAQSEVMMFYVEAKASKYLEAVRHLKQGLFNIHYSQDRVKNILSQLVNIIPSVTLKANKVVNMLFDDVYFNDENNIHQCSVLRQKTFLKDVEKTMNESPEKVLEKLTDLQEQILKPTNLFVYLAADVNLLIDEYGEDAAKVWKDFFNHSRFENATFPTANELRQHVNYTSESAYEDPNSEVRHVVAGIPAAESCYLKQGVRYPIRDWSNPDVAAVRVMMQYLSNEMYHLIRGQGLTYGISVSSSVTEGRMQVKFTRSSQLEAAYGIFMEIIANYTKNGEGEKSPWDPVLLESAKGSQIYDWAEREETLEDLSEVSIKAVLRQAPSPFYNRGFVKAISEVGVEDVTRVAKVYLAKFLDAKNSHLAIVCGPGDVNAITETFNEKFGFDLREHEDFKLEKENVE